jgi:3-hydroxybutyryl-CoA dehydrogenase
MNIGIIGAGTMGVGIAQVAATAGCKVVLFDANAPQIDKALTGLEKPFRNWLKKVKFLRKSHRNQKHRKRRSIAGFKRF